MKLLLTIVQDQDVPALLEALVENDFRATKLASTGGFLRAGNTTLMIGVEKERVQSLLKLIQTICQPREQADPTPRMFGGEDFSLGLEKISVGGAIVFSVDVERFERI